MFADEEQLQIHVKREKAKARLMRKTAWWQRKCAKAACYYCQKPLARDEVTMDHIIPLSRGGFSTKGNIACSCKTCNSKKKDLTPLEWDDYLRSAAE